MGLPARECRHALEQAVQRDRAQFLLWSLSLLGCVHTSHHHMQMLYRTHICVYVCMFVYVCVCVCTRAPYVHLYHARTESPSCCLCVPVNAMV